MKAKTIKIGEKGYQELNKFAGELRAKENRPVSLNEALLRLLETHKKVDIARFAGSWRMSDNEYEKLKADLERLWKTWKIGSL